MFYTKKAEEKTPVVTEMASKQIETVPKLDNNKLVILSDKNDALSQENKSGTILLDKSIVEKKTQVIEKSTPVFEKSTPVFEKTTPVFEKKTQVVEKTTPVVEKTTLVVEKTTPVVEKKTQVVEKKSQGIEKSTPVFEKKTQVVEKKTPVVEKTTDSDSEYGDMPELIEIEQMVEPRNSLQESDVKEKDESKTKVEQSQPPQIETSDVKQVGNKNRCSIFSKFSCFSPRT